MKQRHIMLILLVLIIFKMAPVSALAQTKTPIDSMAAYFEETKLATGSNRSLWNLDLYAPMLLVRQDTRRIYANEPDSAGILTREGGVFTGVLPKEVNISNTSLRWGGREWAMIMLPLPATKPERINILAHELFHRAQKSLGFVSYNPSNDHLDRKEGRVSMRLEMEALKRAISAASPADARVHLTNALTFRAYRRFLFPGADSTENLLELNEGLAEFTGAMMSGRSAEELKSHFTASIDGFVANETFVRSFAYQTLPVYGYLLSESKPGWNKAIGAATDLTKYIERAFDVRMPSDLKHAVDGAAGRYGGEAISREETERDEQMKKRIAGYRLKFIEQPHLELRFENMKISFDPLNIVPLGDKGSVYPTIRVSDNWGILTVKNGALMSPNWDKITVSVPTTIEGRKISGDGWTLELNAGYSVKEGAAGDTYVLRRQ